MKKPLLRLCSLLLIFLLCAAGYLAFRAWTFLHEPPESEGRDVFFDVLPGARLSSVAHKLFEAGLITDEKAFMLLARFSHEQNLLKAGRFALNTGWLPETVLATLVHGKPVLYRITVPEGLTIWQTAKLLEAQGFVQAETFLSVVTDPAFLRHCGIPLPSAEGFLMPDTYLLKKNETQDKQQSGPGETTVSAERKQATIIAQRLVDNFWSRTENLWPGKKRPQAADLKRWVIIASIVEKETALDEERGRVAGVYTNRLAKNMLLQADPTVIYGLGPTFSGRLLYRHLDDRKNPYNTYQHAGLPPGPICSFGTNSLKAALVPEAHDFLYFVAQSDGKGHVFSRTLEEHNKAVQKYRQSKKKPG
ncbi:MAG: endolytic transglycosylase MltG [Desulfovibrio sp.]|nr:endolytic transglycosylase MltG [Desulfovibrio sp.]